MLVVGATADDCSHADDGALACLLMALLLLSL